SISSWVKPLGALGKIAGWQAKHGYWSCSQWENSPASAGSAAPCGFTMGTRTTTGMASAAADASTAAPATTSDHFSSIGSQCIANWGLLIHRFGDAAETILHRTEGLDHHRVEIAAAATIDGGTAFRVRQGGFVETSRSRGVVRIRHR